MTKNNIRELRSKMKMTQRQLADAVSTSQQQIQRIEAGLQSVRVDLAVSISQALNAKLPDVFPGIELPILKAAKRRSSTNPYDNEDLAQELSEVGFDVDPLVWRIWYQLRGGAEGTLWIDGLDKKRLLEAIKFSENRSGLSSFVIFDSGNRRYAINLEHLISCRFLFEIPNTTPDEKNDKNELEMIVNISSNSKPMIFSIIPDEVSLEKNPNFDGECPLQDLLNQIISFSDTFINVMDNDGEDVFVRLQEISMLSVSLAALGNINVNSDP